MISQKENKLRSEIIFLHNFLGEPLNKICRSLNINMLHHLCRGCRVEISFLKTKKYCDQCIKFLGKLEGLDRPRELVRIRDKHTCQSCGKKWVEGTRRFDIHHLNGLCGKKSKNYDKSKYFEGLITLCHKCHFNHPEHSCRKSLPTTK